jgi:hypothetical protein
MILTVFLTSAFSVAGIMGLFSSKVENISKSGMNCVCFFCSCRLTLKMALRLMGGYWAKWFECVCSRNAELEPIGYVYGVTRDISPMAEFTALLRL